MTFDEKNTWIFLVISTLGALIYGVLLGVRAHDFPLTEVAYVGPMLSTIGGAILAGIVGNTIVSTMAPKEAGKRDMRDLEITRFGAQVGQSFVVIGGVAALLMSMAEVKHFWIAQVVYVCFVLSALLGSIARLVAYRKGLPG